MATTWTIAIDWDRDGDYGGTYDDVSSRVISANWFLGLRQPYKDTADNSILTLMLDNSDKRFSPENAGSVLTGNVRPFKPVRIQSDDGTTVRTHWLGWIDSIEPTVGQYGERLVEIKANGPMQFYKAAEVDLELQENKRTDEIIEALIKQVVMPPALTQSWVLGREGNSEIGQTTRLAAISASTNLGSAEATGTLTLQMAADNWVRRGGHTDLSKDSFDVYRAIGDITAAERGRFLFSREGKALFWNRHRLLDDDTIQTTLDDTMTNMTYVYSGLEQIKNEVIVICHPRTISEADDQTLWELGDAIIRVQTGNTRTIYVKYQDEDGNRIGGRDIQVDDLQFQQGTATATVEDKATSTELIFDNTTGEKDAIVTKCVIKGRKITDFNQMEAKSTDQNSIVDYGRRTLRINLPSIDDLDAAQSIANFERRRRAQPRGDVTAVTLMSHGKNGGGQHAHQLARTLGDRIVIKETQAYHGQGTDYETSAGYFIIGEAHKLSAGATLLETTWYLEPVPTGFPWKLGVTGRSEIGETTTLTY